MKERVSVVRQRLVDGTAAARHAVAGTSAAAAAHSWTAEALAKVALPSVPAAETWSLSVADLVGRSDVVPGPAVKALSLLDSFGCIRVGPDVLGFDGTDVEWSAVQEVRVAPLFELLTGAALDKEVDRLRKMLPPVPGRKWVVGRALRTLQALAVRASSTVPSRGDGLSAVCSVRYQGRFGRQRELHPGLAAVLVLAALPEVNDSILATARSHGVLVSGTTAERPGPDGREQLEELAVRLQDELSGPDEP